MRKVQVSSRARACGSGLFGIVAGLLDRNWISAPYCVHHQVDALAHIEVTRPLMFFVVVVVLFTLQRTHRLPKEMIPVEPSAFAAQLIARLEKLKREQDTMSSLEERLQQIQEVCCDAPI